MSDLRFLKGKEANLPTLKDVNTIYFTEDSGKIILGDNVWDSSINKIIELTSGKTATEYVLYLNGNKVFSVPIIKYSVVKNISGCTLSSVPTSVEYNGKITCTVKKNLQNLVSSKVLIGGIDKTKECYNSSNNKLTINNINGNVYLEFIFN